MNGTPAYRSRWLKGSCIPPEWVQSFYLPSLLCSASLQMLFYYVLAYLTYWRSAEIDSSPSSLLDLWFHTILYDGKVHFSGSFAVSLHLQMADNELYPDRKLSAQGVIWAHFPFYQCFVADAVTHVSLPWGPMKLTMAFLSFCQTQPSISVA